MDSSRQHQSDGSKMIILIRITKPSLWERLIKCRIPMRDPSLRGFFLLTVGLLFLAHSLDYVSSLGFKSAGLIETNELAANVDGSFNPTHAIRLKISFLFGVLAPITGVLLRGLRSWGVAGAFLWYKGHIFGALEAAVFNYLLILKAGGF